MRWDDRIFTGTHKEWSWVVMRDVVRNIDRLAVEHHEGHRLCITAFDSGPITPSPEERAIGWTLHDGVMVSPPLTPQLDIPTDEYDEWYIFRSLPKSIAVTDRYVNYGGFNLADAHALAASQDPTWDRTNYDWLVPLQDGFWSVIERLNPVTYIGSGDNDVVVTMNTDFAKLMLSLARKVVG